MSHLPQANTEYETRQAGGGSCCSLSRFATPLMVLLTVLSLSTTAFFVGRQTKIAAAEKADPLQKFDWESTGLPLDATASVIGEKYSMATGFVSEDVEGLFVLDHNSGLLQCNVIYPRMARAGIMGQFSINVADALGTGGKGGEYMMLTGVVQFPRASNNPMAGTVVYVMDTASGNYAGFGIPFNRAVMNANKPQQQPMFVVLNGSANPIVDRDNLR